MHPTLRAPQFRTGTRDPDQAFLRDLVAFYVIFEGMWFCTGFAQILSLGRRNKMVGIAEQYRYILRDESIHLNFGIDVINQIKIENPRLRSPPSGRGQRHARHDALHHQPPVRADRAGAAVPGHRESVPVDERDDGPQKRRRTSSRPRSSSTGPAVGWPGNDTVAALVSGEYSVRPPRRYAWRRPAVSKTPAKRICGLPTWGDGRARVSSLGATDSDRDPPNGYGPINVVNHSRTSSL